MALLLLMTRCQPVKPLMPSGVILGIVTYITYHWQILNTFLSVFTAKYTMMSREKAERYYAMTGRQPGEPWRPPASGGHVAYSGQRGGHEAGAHAYPGSPAQQPLKGYSNPPVVYATPGSQSQYPPQKLWNIQIQVTLNLRRYGIPCYCTH